MPIYLLGAGLFRPRCTDARSIFGLFVSWLARGMSENLRGGRMTLTLRCYVSRKPLYKG